MIYGLPFSYNKSAYSGIPAECRKLKKHYPRGTVFVTLLARLTVFLEDAIEN